jgi:protein gp37
MSDFFHERIKDEQRDKALSTIRKTPQHTYQILTKRSWLMKRYGERIGEFPPNVWLGVSVEDERFKFRIDHLRQTNAALRFVSIEPLIGSVGKLNLCGIHWIIVGGESGPKHREMKVEWVRDIREQCSNGGVAFFFKQWGGRKPKSGGRSLDGREWNEFPQRLETQPMVIDKSLPSLSEMFEVRTPH